MPAVPDLKFNIELSTGTHCKGLQQTFRLWIYGSIWRVLILKVDGNFISRILNHSFCEFLFHHKFTWKSSAIDMLSNRKSYKSPRWLILVFDFTWGESNSERFCVLGNDWMFFISTVRMMFVEIEQFEINCFSLDPGCWNRKWCCSGNDFTANTMTDKKRTMTEFVTKQQYQPSFTCPTSLCNNMMLICTN